MSKINQLLLNTVISQLAIVHNCQSNLSDCPQSKNELHQSIEDFHKLVESVVSFSKLTGADEQMHSCLQKVELELLNLLNM